ncbi:M43 family zinc metalloprotease [Spongiimicrobium sp. 2-473A-2-J]|uniref:M43 family zinc metalloprotease n=1 Tax=Eudoraea algarum TaxID=3417568 RepID=UPI003D361B2A
MRTLLLSILFMLSGSSYAQMCGTTGIDGNTSKKARTTSLTNRINSNAPIVINLYFNILNAGSSSNVTVQQCKDALVTLNRRYAASNIVFRYNGYGNYYNNASAVINSRTEYEGLRNINRNTSSIQVFLIDGFNINGNTGIIGRAELPGRFMALRKDYRNSFVFAHELGHNLNLFHTFHGMSCERDNSIPEELANGSNCASAGDLVCDTPADPCMNQGTVNNQCGFTGNNTYSPDTRNFMSYTRLNCGNRFTAGQISRMREALVLNDDLQTVQVSASQLAKPLKISSTRTNYRRTRTRGGCFNISYWETDKLQFQRGFNYNIRVTNRTLNTTSTYNFTATTNPVVNVSVSSYSYNAKITSYSPNPTYSSRGSAGYVSYIHCPIWIPLMTTETAGIQSGPDAQIRPGLYAVPIRDERNEQIIETPKMMIRN